MLGDVQGTASARFATPFERLGAQLFYQGWADGGTVNGYRDKDFAGFAVSYTF